MSATAVSIEQRQYSRIRLSRPATIALFNCRSSAELVDVSLRGARLHVPPSLPAGEGQLCTVTVHLDPQSARIEMSGAVVHRSSAELAVRWHKIDLDSLAHLRRLLELHLADDRMVHGELTRLAADAAPSAH